MWWWWQREGRRGRRRSNWDWEYWWDWGWGRKRLFFEPEREVRWFNASQLCSSVANVVCPRVEIHTDESFKRNLFSFFYEKKLKKTEEAEKDEVISTLLTYLEEKFKKVRFYTKEHVFNSTVALKTYGKKIYEIYRELKRLRREKDWLEKKKDLSEKERAELEKLKTAFEEAKQGKIERLSELLTRSEELEEEEEEKILARFENERKEAENKVITLASGAGLDPDSLSKTEKALIYIVGEKVKNDVLERLGDIMSSLKGKEKFGSNYLERKLTRSNEIHRATPNELALFADEKTKKLLALRSLEGLLNSYSDIPRAKKAYGDFVMCLDTSGSMEDNARISKALGLFLFLALRAMRKKLNFAVVCFNSRVGLVKVFEGDKISAISDFLESAKDVFEVRAGGGTDYVSALDKAVEVAKKLRGKPSLLFLSDGLPAYSPSPELKDRVCEAFKERIFIGIEAEPNKFFEEHYAPFFSERYEFSENFHIEAVQKISEIKKLAM